MEKDKLVEEFRLADVAAQVLRKTLPDGRNWLEIRAVRFYEDASGIEKESTLLRVDDVPVAQKQLELAYLSVKASAATNKKSKPE